MKTPKRNISRSGLRSWLRRHPRHFVPFPPGRAIEMLMRMMFRDGIENMQRAIRAQTQELQWFPQADAMPK